MELSESFVDSALYEGKSYVNKSGRRVWRDQIHWDDELPGLGLKITRTNRKTYVVSYRAGGRKRRKTLGQTSELTLAEARERAAELLGGEPAAAAPPPPATAGIETVAELAAAYLEQHLKVHSPSSFTEQRLIRAHIKPAMGRMALAEVSSADLTSLRARVTRQFPSDGRRLTGLLKGMFDWAAERGLWSPTRKAAPRRRPAAAGGGRAARRQAKKKAAPRSKAATLAAALEESERQRRELAERLREVSEGGAEMMEEMNRLAAERQRLTARLERTEEQLRRARDEPAEPEPAGETAKTLANLKRSVGQLMDALKESENAREELEVKLRRAGGQDQRLVDRVARLKHERALLERRLREGEWRGAHRAVESGRGRLLAWLAAGAVGGLVVGLVLASLLA